MNRKIVFCAILILFLAETLLSPDLRSIQSDIQGATNPSLKSLASSYENVTTHQGDLIIDGTQTFVIENCTYIETGNIYVRDWAKLIVRNAELQVSVDVEFNESSEADFDNVSLTTGGYTFFKGSSKVNINALVTVESPGISFFDSCDANIQNSNIGQAFIFIFYARTPRIKFNDSSIEFLSLRFTYGLLVNVTDLIPGNCMLDLQEKVQILGTLLDISFNNTYVHNWGLEGYYGYEMNILNSTLGRLFINVQGLVVTLDNLKQQYYEYERVGQIVLNNTDLTGRPGGFGIRIDSPFSLPTDILQPSVVTILDSTVDLLPEENPSILVRNSKIGLLYAAGQFYGTLCFEGEGNRWTAATILNSDFHVSGNVSFNDWNGIEWDASDVTREYDVIATDSYGRLFSDASSTLYTKEDTAVWNGTTDIQGRADFNLTFADNNYTDTWSLNVSKEGFYNETMDIGFLSDTPVSIVLTEKIPGDLNLDREVSLADLVLLAQAYGSKPGDSNWNPNADINGNGIVDLADLVILAQHYGQHYP
jgi:hypothetical protein